MTCESPQGGSYRDIEKQSLRTAMTQAVKDAYTERRHNARSAKLEEKKARKAEREARKKGKMGGQNNERNRQTIQSVCRIGDNQRILHGYPGRYVSHHGGGWNLGRAYMDPTSGRCYHNGGHSRVLHVEDQMREEIGEGGWPE